MKKIRITLPAILCFTVLLAGCASGGGSVGGGDSGSSADVMRYNAIAAPMEIAEEYDYYNEAEAYDDGYGGVSMPPPVTEARKVVTSAEFYITTDDFAGAMRRLDHKIATSGSYIQQSGSYAATEYSTASANMTIRVPVSMYGDFKSFLTDLAEITSASEFGEDVTAQYYDTESRLQVLQAQEARIKTFIANSRDLDEIFRIERELSRISIEIEQLTTVRNRLDNLTSYATVYVSVSEVSDGKFVKTVAFGDRVNNALKGSVDNIVVAAQALLLVVIWCWPLLLVAAAVILIVRKFVKRRKKPDSDLLSKFERVKKEEE